MRDLIKREIYREAVRRSVFKMIDAERRAQDEKWGDQSGNAPERWSTILSEECGEAAKEVLDESPREVLVDELVQVAAVAVAWIEALWGEKPLIS